MKHLHRLRRSVRAFSARKKILVPVVTVLIIGIGSLAVAFHTSSASASPEVQFTDASRSGLAIVPASGASDPYTCYSSGPHSQSETCTCTYGGTYPSCTVPCPSGYTGTYPNCVIPSQNSCPSGYTGTYPDCLPPGPNSSCPVGYTGTYPNCSAPSNPSSNPTTNTSTTNTPTVQPSFTLDVDGSQNPPTIQPGQTFYFTWSAQGVSGCTPYMASNTDQWWTGGAGIASGGSLPTSYGDPSNYQATGLPHSLSQNGTYSYAASCQSGVSLVGNPLFASVAYAGTLYQSVPVTVSIGCPLGYANQGGRCAFIACPPGSSQSTNGGGATVCSFTIPVSCARGYMCGADGDLYQLDASCGYSATPADTCGNIGCSSATNQCNVPGATIIKALSVAPILLSSGKTTVVSWQVSDVNSCTATGTNGDSWSCSGAACAAPNAETSSSITGQTIYTLQCQPLAGAVNPDGSPYSWTSETAVVNIAPVYQER